MPRTYLRNARCVGGEGIAWVALTPALISFTYIPTDVCILIHIYTYIYVLAHTRTHTHVHIRPPIIIGIHSDTRTYMYVYIPEMEMAAMWRSSVHCKEDRGLTEEESK